VPGGAAIAEREAARLPNPPRPAPAADPALGDPVIAYTPLYGHRNLTDSAWHDDTWAFMEYGPITVGGDGAGCVREGWAGVGG
jgi:hypothetical protein